MIKFRTLSYGYYYFWLFWCCAFATYEIYCLYQGYEPVWLHILFLIIQLTIGGLYAFFAIPSKLIDDQQKKNKI